MIEIAGLSSLLLSMGLPGAVILYLMYDIKQLKEKLHSCQEAHMADIKKFSGELTTALVTSTELMRANNVIQDKAADSAGRLGVAVDKIREAIEHYDETLERSRK